MITKQNIEEYILMYVDQELSTDESAALLNFLEQYPEYKVMLADYEATVLQIDEAIVFPDKDKLYKAEVPATLVLPMVNTKVKWWKVTAVAAAIVIVCFGANQLYIDNVIAVKHPGNQTVAANNAPDIPEKTLTTSTEDDKFQPIAPRITKPSNVIRASNTKLPVANDVQEPLVDFIETEEMALLVNNRLPVVTSTQKLHSSFSKPQLVDNNEVSNLLSENVKNNPLIADIREQVKEKIEDFKEVSEVLKYASISLSVGNKNIVIKK